MPTEIWSMIKWLGIISCISIWLKYLLKDLIDFLLRDEKSGDTDE